MIVCSCTAVASYGIGPVVLAYIVVPCCSSSSIAVETGMYV
jgi:hypothetical protein